MRSEFLIARRLYASHGKQGKMSGPAVRVALLGTAIGLAVMIASIFVVTGFKREVRNKVSGFGGDIQVVNFDNNHTYEMQAVRMDSALLLRLGNIKGVESVSRFCTKPGMLKTLDHFHAVIYKGLDEGAASWAFFRHQLVGGHLPVADDEVLLSASVARLLGLELDTNLLCYFVQETVRVRRVRVTGFYETGFSECDNLFMVGMLPAVQQLNGWESDEVSGAELRIRAGARLDDVSDRIYFATANQSDDEGRFFHTQTVEDINPGVFAWLALLDMNVVVIIVLMLAVSVFGMVSGLLILILESIRLTGILKALGAEDAYLRRIFLAEALLTACQGMVWGNGVGLGLCALQYWFHLLPLDASAYYMSYVPICFDWGWWIVVNFITFVVLLLALLGPSAIVRSVSPAKVMRFE